MSSSTQYRSELDGLRAIAVLLVVFFHAGLGVTGGFVGVDVFFVISGFLIVGIVEREIEEKTFSLSQFWVRRCRRILPAVSVMVIAILAAGCLLMLPHDYKELGQATVAQALGLSNFYYFRESNYFADVSDIKPLLHTWSLAVEEQFYVLLPLLYLALRNWKRTVRFLLLLVVFLASLSWSIASTDNYPTASFYLLPARAWELALGGLLGYPLFRRDFSSTCANILMLLGLGLIAVSAFDFDRTTVFPGANALLPCIGAGLVIIGGQCSGSGVAKFLSVKPLVFVGKMSYSLYLWHWPLFAFFNYVGFYELSHLISTVLILSAFAMSVLSWRFVEEPFRRRVFWNNKRNVFGASALSGACLLISGLAIHGSAGIPERFSATVIGIADARSQRSPLSKLHHDLPISSLAMGIFPTIGTANAQPSIMVLGDSHGDAAIPAVDSVLREAGLAAYCVTASATLPLFASDVVLAEDRKQAFVRAVHDFFISRPEISDLVLIGRWNHYEVNPEFERRLAITANACFQRKVRLWIVTQVPEPHGNVPRYLALAMRWERPTSELSSTQLEYDGESKAFLDLVMKVSKVSPIRLVRLDDAFFDEFGRSVVAIAGRPLFWDDDHLSIQGAEYSIPVFRKMVDQMLQMRYLSGDE